MKRCEARLCRVLAACLFGLSLAACADQAIVGPAATVDVAALDRPAGPAANRVAAGLTPITCTLAWKAPTGAFRIRQVEVGFPVADLHPDGALRSYVYHGYAGDQLVRFARCAIPATEGCWASYGPGARHRPTGCRRRRPHTNGVRRERRGMHAGSRGRGWVRRRRAYPNCSTQVDVDYAYNCFYDGTCAGSGGSTGEATVVVVRVVALAAVSPAMSTGTVTRGTTAPVPGSCVYPRFSVAAPREREFTSRSPTTTTSSRS